MDQDQFNLLSKGELAEWLEQHLVSMHEANARARRSLAELGIREAESDFDALVRLFELVERATQQNFHSAIETLLRRALPGVFPRGAMRDLVLLTGATRAYDALPALLPVLGAGVWGEKAPELFYYALSVLKGLKQDKVTYETTKQLVTTSNFPAQYAFDVFEILIGACPERWFGDFRELEELLRRASDDGILPPEAIGPRYDRLVEELLDAVQLHDLASGLPQLLKWQFDVRSLHPLSPAGRLCAALRKGELIVYRGRDIAITRRDRRIQSPMRALDPAGELYLDQLMSQQEEQHQGMALPHYESWSAT